MTIRFSVQPIASIDYREFYRAVNQYGTMETDQELKRLWKECQKVMDYKWDTPAIHISNIFGTSFTAHIYQNNKGKITLTLWDDRGHVSLGSYLMQEYGFQGTEFTRLCDVMNDWTRGFMPCSHCGKRINYQDNSSHSYFAGIYCLECWDKTYKAKEAKETYN